MRMLYCTSWPDNAGAVAVQIDKMLSMHGEADLWLFTGLVRAIFLQEYD